MVNNNTTHREARKPTVTRRVERLISEGRLPGVFVNSGGYVVRERTPMSWGHWFEMAALTRCCIAELPRTAAHQWSREQYRKMHEMNLRHVRETRVVLP